MATGAGRGSRRLALTLAMLAGLVAARSSADTITILGTAAPVVNGWNFETRALAPIDACDATHTAHQPAAFNPNSAFLTFTAFQAYATPPRQQISNVVIDFLGGSDAGTGLSGFQAQVVGKTPTATVTWNEDVLDCQWRFRNQTGGGGLGWPIFDQFTTWDDPTVNNLQIRVRRAGAGDHDLRVNGVRIVVFTIPQLPDPPTGLGVTNVTTSTISLSWTLATSGGVPVNIQVERATGSPSNGYGVVATLAGDATSYQDGGPLAERTTYFYRLRAFNTTGPSAYSTETSGTTLNSIYQLLFTRQPGNVSAGSVINGSTGGVEVTGVDGSGFVVPTFSGSITLSLGSASCAGPLQGTLTKNAVNGVATFTDLTIPSACAAETLVATSPGIPVPSHVSAAFVVSPGAADHLHALSQPTDVYVGQAMPAFQVEVLDAFGNRVTTPAFSMHLAVNTGPSGGALIGTTDTTTVSGVATFLGVRLSKAGSYTLLVTAAGVTNGSLVTSAFNVQSVIAAPQLQVDLLGQGRIRGDTRTAVDVVVTNAGNQDATAVPLWIAGIPTNATVEADFALSPPPRSAGEPDWAQAPLALNGAAGKYLALVIPRLAPGQTVRRIYLTVPASDPIFQLRAGVTPPWADNAGALGACLADAGVPLQAPCMATQLGAIQSYMAANPSLDALNGIGVWAKEAWQCDGAGTLAAALAKAEQVLDALVAPTEQPGGLPPSCAEVAETRWRSVLAETVVVAVDPNAKFGPGGDLAAGRPVPYEIKFENVGTAPARQVTVADSIDVATFDPATVSLLAITFGVRSILLPPGLHQYSADVSMLERNLTVRLGVELDPATGLLNWSLISVDPATGQPLPPSSLNGFLPPNTTPPQGEGSVLFTVSPRTSLASGAQIQNRASLSFDGQRGVMTPYWQNTLQATTPESHVLPLPATQESSTFTVRWTSSTPANSLRDFTVYVADEQGPYQPWKLNTQATAGQYTAAQRDHRYFFYSVARDVVGNIEPAPSGPDAQTIFMDAVEDGPLQLGLAVESNPARGRVRVQFTLPGPGAATLELLDVGGRRVERREVGVLGAGRHTLALGGDARLAPGLYWLRLQRQSDERVGKVVIIR